MESLTEVKHHYRQAPQRYEGLTKTPLSKGSLERLVNEYGGGMATQQTEEAEATVKAPEKEEEIVWREMPEPDSEVMAVSLDETLIYIRGEGWKEVKVATIPACPSWVSQALRTTRSALHKSRP